MDRSYFNTRDLFVELGGLYATVNLFIGRLGVLFMVIYFWWLGGTYKRLSAYKLNFKAINEIKGKLTNAHVPDKDLQNEIDDALKQDIDEFGYMETKNFRQHLETLYEKAKVLSKLDLDDTSAPRNPIFETSKIISGEKKLEDDLHKILEESKEKSVLEHIMEIKETVSILNVLKMNEELKK